MIPETATICKIAVPIIIMIKIIIIIIIIMIIIVITVIIITIIIIIIIMIIIIIIVIIEIMAFVRKLSYSRTSTNPSDIPAGWKGLLSGLLSLPPKSSVAPLGTEKRKKVTEGKGRKAIKYRKSLKWKKRGREGE